MLGKQKKCFERQRGTMFNLANKITLLRILMAPLVVILLYFEGPVFCVLAALAFIFASITDWVDGYIARRENMVTSMGKFLDPLADKVLICSVLIMFVKLGWAPAWVVIVIVCRELVVTGLRAMAIDEGVVLAADYFGKAKTVLQIFAVVPLMLHYPHIGGPALAHRRGSSVRSPDPGPDFRRQLLLRFLSQHLQQTPA